MECPRAAELERSASGMSRDDLEFMKHLEGVSVIHATVDAFHFSAECYGIFETRDIPLLQFDKAA